MFRGTVSRCAARVGLVSNHSRVDVPSPFFRDGNPYGTADLIPAPANPYGAAHLIPAPANPYGAAHLIPAPAKHARERDTAPARLGSSHGSRVLHSTALALLSVIVAGPVG
ncbi:unnamed protein product [Diplocarpon coronariae]